MGAQRPGSAPRASTPPSARARTIGSVGGAMLLTLANAGVAAASPKPLHFDDVFSDRGEPAAMEFHATYVNASGTHGLDVWRDADRRLKRVTDGLIEIHVARPTADAQYDMVVLDLRRKIETRIGRANLYRVGNFSDWFDLSHGLRHPRGDYLIVASTPLQRRPRPVEPCDWYDLKQGPRATHICWSRRVRLPLLIETDDGQVIWRIDAMTVGPIPAAALQIHDQGFVRNDADQDIDRD